MGKSATAVHVIGGGLAGSEAAWQLARAGVPAVLHEMRPVRGTPAHVTDALAELVCSNSFRSDDVENNAVGLLHEEMRRCGSLVMRAAGRQLVGVGRAHDQRARATHLLVQQADRVVAGVIGTEGVGTDELGEIFREMRLGAAHRPHLVQHHGHAGRRELPGRFAAGEATAYNVHCLGA